ncbi:MAG: TFIIB-type zinc ribbon-containing protein [Pirellulales bacterium]
MPIEFRCTQCAKLLRTPDNTAGKQAKCPQCGAIVTIPETPPSTPSASRETNPFTPPPPSPRADNPFAPGAQPSYGFAPGEENPYQSPASFSPGAQSPFGPAQRGFTPTQIDAGEVFSRAWTIFKNQLGMCLMGYFVVWAISFGVSMAFSLMFMVPAAMLNDEKAIFLLNIASRLATMVFSVWIGIGQTVFYFKIARGEEASLTDLFSGSRWFWPILGASILLVFMILLGPVACIILGWMFGQFYLILACFVALALCIIPGVILFLMFGQSYYLIIDRNVPVMDAFSLSKEITTGNKLTLLLLGLIAFAILILGFLALCVGVFFAYPLAILISVVAYLMMTGQDTAGQRLADPALR